MSDARYKRVISNRIVKHIDFSLCISFSEYSTTYTQCSL